MWNISKKLCPRIGDVPSNNLIRCHMKKSTIVNISSVLVLCEIVISFYCLNKKYQFCAYTIQLKYLVLTRLVYLIFYVFSIVYVGFINKVHFLKCYGTYTFNFLYTWHFIIFTAIMFHAECWVWSFVGIILFIIWNWVRCKQNEYAYAMNLIKLKELGKKKPIVVLK